MATKKGSKKPKLKVVRSSSFERPLTPVEKQYFTDLHSLVDDIYTRACDIYDMSWTGLASAAGLAYGTVASLGNRETRFPRFMTIYKLAVAVGLQIRLHEIKTKAKAAGLKLAKTG